MKLLKRSACTALAIWLLIQIPVNTSAQDTTLYGTKMPDSVADTASLPNYWEFKESNPGSNYGGDDIVVQAAENLNIDGAEIEIKDFEGKSRAILWKNESGIIEWKVTVPQTGYYRLGIEYSPLHDRENDIEVAVLVNGSVQYAQAEGILLPRVWKDDGKVRKDALGNELSPVQVQASKWLIEWVKDVDGLSLAPLTFLLEKGENVIGIELMSGMIGLSRIILGPVTQAAPYLEVSKNYDSSQNYDEDPIVIEGESAKYKSTKALRPMSDRSDPSVTPSDVYNQKINYIGSYNWKRPGEKITWEVNIPEDGLYQIHIKYRQSYLRNGSSIRRLTIDDQVPFAECENIKFKYGLRWNILTLGGNKQPQSVYLNKGRHEISLEVTLGEYASISRRLEKLVFEIGDTYRKMVMITGAEPDMNRDYRLYAQIPNLLENLKSYREQLISMADELDSISGSRGGSDAVVLRNLANVMGRMLRSRFRIHEYVKDYFNNYCSVSAWMYEMRNMPLDIDAIILSSPDRKLTGFSSTFFERTVYSFKKFIVSFTKDYNTISISGENQESISLWLNWGRDQAQVLDSMIKDQFSINTNISVNIKLVNASLIQAILSGNAPDCSLMLSRGQPVNLAMRGALYNLAKFTDFDEVISRFAPGATVPYEYKGGIYGLPDTQQFFMMFCRTDIMEQLGLEVPTTWDELIRCAAVIMRNNMQIGIPYTQITDMYQTETGIGSMNIFPALLYQYGSEIYNNDRTGTNLMSAEAVQAFTFWTSIYSEYKFPISYDFFNRFRTGDMPIAIANYTEYSRLMAAAPEIRGRWSIRQVPGRIVDGKLNNTTSGGGTAAVILKGSRNIDAAWEFLKWWTSKEAQYRFGSEIESILGIAARHPTSNQEAFGMQSWKKKDYNELTAQWMSVKEVPEVPGGYFTQRALDNAFWNTVNNHANPRDMLLKWARTIDEEIERKMEEYKNN